MDSSSSSKSSSSSSSSVVSVPAGRVLGMRLAAATVAFSAASCFSTLNLTFTSCKVGIKPRIVSLFRRAWWGDGAEDEAEDVEGNGCALAAPLEEPEPPAVLPPFVVCRIDRMRSRLRDDFDVLGFGSCVLELMASTDGEFEVVSAVLVVDEGVDEVEGVGLSVGVEVFFFLGWDRRISARVDIISIFFLNASDLLSSVAGDLESD